MESDLNNHHDNHNGPTPTVPNGVNGFNTTTSTAPSTSAPTSKCPPRPPPKKGKELLLSEDREGAIDNLTHTLGDLFMDGVLAPTPTGLMDPTSETFPMVSEKENAGMIKKLFFLTPDDENGLTVSTTQFTQTFPRTPEKPRPPTPPSNTTPLHQTIDPSRLQQVTPTLDMTLSGSSTPFTPQAKRAITTRLPEDLELFDEGVGFNEVDVKKDLVLKEKLAEGAYGTVWKALFRSKPAAVKIQQVPMEDYEQVNILSELSILRSLVHPRLVKYEGAALLQENEEEPVDPQMPPTPSSMTPGRGKRRSSHIKPPPVIITNNVTQPVVNEGDEQPQQDEEESDDEEPDMGSWGWATSSNVNVPLTGFKVMIVMELCENGALREGLLAHLSWGLKVRIAADVAEGLDVLHRHQLIHRDLKTTNILLDSEWRAKICDHSFAISVHSPEIRLFTCGTYEFMSPEMAMGDPYDCRTDIFSYGVVLAEMIAEREPGTPQNFLCRESRTFFELNGDEVTEAALPGCPPSFLNLALQCVKTDMDLRPSAEEALEWLRSLDAEMTAKEKRAMSDGGGGSGSEPSDRNDDGSERKQRSGPWRGIRLPKGRPPPPSPEPQREGHVTRPNSCRKRAVSLGGGFWDRYKCYSCRDAKALFQGSSSLTKSPTNAEGITMAEMSRRRSWPLQSAESKRSECKLAAISSCSSCDNSDVSPQAKKRGDSSSSSDSLLSLSDRDEGGGGGLFGNSSKADAEEGILPHSHRHHRSTSKRISRRRRRSSGEGGAEEKELRPVVEQLGRRVEELQAWKERHEKRYGGMVETLEMTQSQGESMLKRWDNLEDACGAMMQVLATQERMLQCLQLQQQTTTDPEAVPISTTTTTTTTTAAGLETAAGHMEATTGGGGSSSSSSSDPQIDEALSGCESGVSDVMKGLVGGLEELKASSGADPVVMLEKVGALQGYMEKEVKSRLEEVENKMAELKTRLSQMVIATTTTSTQGPPPPSTTTGPSGTVVPPAGAPEGAGSQDDGVDLISSGVSIRNSRGHHHTRRRKKKSGT